jgi:hypothetical protein
MIDVPELFWNASLDNMKRGFVYDDRSEAYVCLVCGRHFEEGIVYPREGVYYEAKKYVRQHITDAHTSMFDYLMSLDKKLTGLTDHQNSLLRLFHEGKSDADIQKETGIGSASTIRNHRFVLKEKERQAKVLLVLMELLKDKDKHAPTIVPFHQSATMIDDRYNITQDEYDKVISKYFPQGPNGPLISFSMKEKYKLVILRELAKRFDKGKSYTEKQVNELLKASFDDYVTLRRYLIEYGFMDRKLDGSQYWIKE